MRIGRLYSKAAAVAAIVLATSAATTVTASAAKPGGDVERPSAPVLTATTAGAGEIGLSWTEATDDIGVARYEIRRDGGVIADLSPTTLAHVDADPLPGMEHAYRVLAYDAAGNSRSSNSVLAAASGDPAPPPPPPPPPPADCTERATFPSRLATSGRSLLDENGCPMPTLRGFNMHVGPGFTWEQEHFDAIGAAGGRINRAVLHWDQFEPRKGVIDATAIANLDLHIQRAQAAGIYTLLELHLNVGRLPSWANKGNARARDETEAYFINGQPLTRFLAARYGNPASPNHTKAVVGFGLNEPPLGDWIRNSNGSIPWLEKVQGQMLSWLRAPGSAPAWVGFVAYGYASATPIYDRTWQLAAAADANPAAYDGEGGNVVIDVHDYAAGCTNDDPDCDGRQPNGMIWPTFQGGPLRLTDSGYVSSAVRRSQYRAYLRPYATFATEANLPLMVGEWGWTEGATGELDWLADKQPAWAEAGATIEIYWNYDIDASKSPWAARPRWTWRPSVAAWLAAEGSTTDQPVP